MVAVQKRKEATIGPFTLANYRRQWPRMGAVLGLGGATVPAAGRRAKPHLLSTPYFISLLVRQYEENQDPGYFPGQVRGRSSPAASSAQTCLRSTKTARTASPRGLLRLARGCYGFDTRIA
jgi:hypothetical protein